MKKEKEKDNIIIETGLYDKMYEFFNRPERTKILLGARRIGKTISIFYYMINKILNNRDKQYRFLFLDVSYSQISKYIEAYVIPVLSKLPKKQFKWDIQRSRNDIYLCGSQILCRTQTIPDNLVGLEYDAIFANECSYSIDTKFLYEQVLLPMLINRKGDMYLIGAPTNSTSYFKDLSDSAENGLLGDCYFTRITSYETPYLEKEEVDRLCENMDSESVKSEIYAQWSKSGGNKFFYMFDVKKHIYVASEDISNRWLHLSFDFNVSPISCICYEHIGNELKVLAEIIQYDTNIDKFCDYLLTFINPAKIESITGDASGSNNTAHSYQNFYQKIQSKLDLHKSIFQVPMSNPRHTYSRIVCNTALEKQNVLINSECKQLIKDINKMIILPDMTLDKKKYDGHVGDTLRYCMSRCYKLPDLLKDNSSF